MHFRPPAIQMNGCIQGQVRPSSTSSTQIAVISAAEVPRFVPEMVISLALKEGTCGGETLLMTGGAMVINVALEVADSWPPTLIWN